jgi:hypothetical protein
MMQKAIRLVWALALGLGSVSAQALKLTIGDAHEFGLISDDGIPSGKDPEEAHFEHVTTPFPSAATPGSPAPAVRPTAAWVGPWRTPVHSPSRSTAPRNWAEMSNRRDQGPLRPEQVWQ